MSSQDHTTTKKTTTHKKRPKKANTIKVKTPRGRTINRSFTEAHVDETRKQKSDGNGAQNSSSNCSHVKDSATFLSTPGTRNRPRSRSVGVCDHRLQGLR
jgi:hypothetical protein